MNIRQFLKRIGTGLLDFCESMAEAHKKRMETPTPCRQCKGIYLYKELGPSLYTWLTLRESPPYKQISLKEGYVLNRYCPACWEIICQKYENEYRLASRFRKEAVLVEVHNERARLLGREATLTISQWIKTLEYYDWRCAYCGALYEELDHWIPLDGEGGTVAEKCVPSCRSCNRRKGTRHPNEIMDKESSLSPAAHRRIQAEMEALQ